VDEEELDDEEATLRAEAETVMGEAPSEA